MKTARCFFILFLLAACIVPQTSHAKYTDTITKEFQVNSGGTLIVDSDIGTIEVYTHASDNVTIEITRKVTDADRDEAEKYLENLDIDMSKRGSDVTIKTTFDRPHRWKRNNLSLKYVITVPESYNLDLKTSGGGISVSDLTGNVKCKTSGGGLCFGNIEGPVHGETSGGGITLKSSVGDAVLKTSGGGITLGDVNGDVTATTSGGSIRIDKVSGHVDACTSGGGIHVDEVMGYINASTSGGSVTARLTGQPAGECRLTTSGGGIRLTMKRDISLDVDARSSGGSVSTEMPVTVSGYINKSQLKAKINGGGPLMYLRTSGGNISLSEM